MVMKAVLINLIMEKLGVVSSRVRTGDTYCYSVFMKYGFLAVESLPFHKIKSKVEKLLKTFNLCELIMALLAIFNHSCILE